MVSIITSSCVYLLRLCLSSCICVVVQVRGGRGEGRGRSQQPVVQRTSDPRRAVSRHRLQVSVQSLSLKHSCLKQVIRLACEQKCSILSLSTSWCPYHWTWIDLSTIHRSSVNYGGKKPKATTKVTPTSQQQIETGVPIIRACLYDDDTEDMYLHMWGIVHT